MLKQATTDVTLQVNALKIKQRKSLPLTLCLSTPSLSSHWQPLLHQLTIPSLVSSTYEMDPWEKLTNKQIKDIDTKIWVRKMWFVTSALLDKGNNNQINNKAGRLNIRVHTQCSLHAAHSSDHRTRGHQRRHIQVHVMRKCDLGSFSTFYNSK